MKWLPPAFCCEGILLAALLALGGCASMGPTAAPRAKPVSPAVVYSTVKDSAPKPGQVPPNLANIPDAVPVPEPAAKSGNPDSYEALGEQYIVQKEPPLKGYFESGKASWYGKKFHGRRTATGETYDMFAMTAAHKTLRLPSYARVTNLDNGKSCVVKINDRGPFVKGRIVDVSYAAATKLDMISSGHANVALELMVPNGQSNEMEVPPTPPRYLRAGLFSDAVDAVVVQDKINNAGLNTGDLLQLPASLGKPAMLTLMVGPFASYAEQEVARLKLGRLGITTTASSN